MLGIGVDRIEDHAIPLANLLNTELRALGFEVLTPEGNASTIVAFKHGAKPDDASALFDKAGVKISLREQATQVRAGVALFNNRSDIDRLLEVAESLRA